MCLPAAVGAQTVLGTFHWQLAPYCNTLTLTVVQDAAGIRLQGTEDRCDPVYLPQSVEGSAALTSGNTAVISLSSGIPGGFSFQGTRIFMILDVTTLNGSWADDAGRSGTLVPVGSPTNLGEQRGGDPMTFLHVVTADNRPTGGADNVTCFSHQLTNGNPSALILWSANRGNQSSLRPLVPSTISLYYDDNGTGLPGELANNVWCLSRNDSQTMPLGAGFTIRVAPR
jgi:hypothetical protein